MTSADMAIQYQSETIKLEPKRFDFQSGAAISGDSFAKYEEANSLKFVDLVDIVNPLQHIPVVNHFYREGTGDEIKPAAQILGGGLFGGVIGMATATANSVIESQTGQDMASHFFNHDNAVTAQEEDYAHNNANRYNE